MAADHPGNGLDLGTQWAKLGVHGPLGLVGLIVLVFALAVGALIWTNYRGFSTLAEARDAQTQFFLQQHGTRAAEIAALDRRMDRLTTAILCFTWVQASPADRQGLLRSLNDPPLCWRL